MESKPIVQAVNKVVPDQARVEQLAQTLHSTVDKLAAKAGPVADKAHAAAYSAAEKAQDGLAALKRHEEDWVRSGTDYIRANPLTAVALGVLAGAILAKLTSSSR